MPFMATEFYTKMPAMEHDRHYSDAPYTLISSPIPGSPFNPDRRGGIMRSLYTNPSEGMSTPCAPGIDATVSSTLYSSTTYAGLQTSACAPISQQGLTIPIPENASTEFRREDLKIQLHKRFQRSNNRSYAVQLQVDKSPSKAWVIRIYPIKPGRDGPKLHVDIDLDSDQPYRFPPKPAIGRQGPNQQLYCSKATLHARSLMDVLGRMRTYKSYKERTLLSPRDRKVLDCALDRIGDGDFTGAVTRPWKAFKATCQSWAESGKWEETKYSKRIRSRRRARTSESQNAPKG